MKCYYLEDNKIFDLNNKKMVEVDKLLEEQINEICSNWQIRNLKQEGVYDGDDITSVKEYQDLIPENFVVGDGKFVGYYYSSNSESVYVVFDGTKKVKISSYDDSQYEVGGVINRGFIEIVSNPDNETNLYFDLPRFHSQAEYDDHIKWQD